MRDLTTRAFCDMFPSYGEPDFYVSEFLRVHASSTIDRGTREMLSERTSRQPIFVQLLGREPGEFVRIANLLAPYAIAGININFGCPMAKICRKGVGGGLLNEPEMIDAILGEMARRIDLPLSVKIRTGFDSASNFEHLIGILAKHDLNFVAVHARTVRGLYGEGVNFSHVKLAKDALKCKVFANGDINSAHRALSVVEQTCCDGVMIGRAAVGNPFIFRQIRELQTGAPCFKPRFGDLYLHVLRLMDSVGKRTSSERKYVGGLKKYLNFIGQNVDKTGEFLRQVRHATDGREIAAAVNLHIGSRGDEYLPETRDCGWA
jgi:tRNA-dihydrouridine synthase